MDGVGVVYQSGGVRVRVAWYADIDHIGGGVGVPKMICGRK